MDDPLPVYRVHSFNTKQFAQLEDAWKRLERGADMTAFQSYQWMELVNEHALHERASRAMVRTRYYLVERDGVPVLIAPLRVHLAPLSPDHQRGVHFIGRNGPADYLNLIYNEFDSRAAETALAQAVRDFGLSTFRLERMLSDTDAQAWASGMPGATSQTGSAVRLILPTSLADYSAMLSKSTRQNIRTAWNRSHKDGLEITVAVSSSLSRAEAEELASIKRNRETQRFAQRASTRDRFLVKLRRAYFSLVFAPQDATVQAMSRTERPWVLRVRADDMICAFAFGLGDYCRGQRTLRILQVAIEDRFSRYSPGMIGLHSFITGEIEHSRPSWDVIDFTRGDEQYKFQLGGEIHRTCSVHFQNASSSEHTTPSEC